MRLFAQFAAYFFVTLHEKDFGFVRLQSKNLTLLFPVCKMNRIEILRRILTQDHVIADTFRRREDWRMKLSGKRLAALFLSGVLLACPLAAQAAPVVQQISAKNGSGLELEVTELDLEITADDPRPKAYLYTGAQSSDYYFIVWMSSNPAVATVDGDGRVTGRSAGTAVITAVSDRGDRAACKVTVRKETEHSDEKPVLDQTSLDLTIRSDALHPSRTLSLLNNAKSFVYVYQWMSSDPAVATVDEHGTVTAQGVGKATITALASNGQALRCSVTVTSEIGKVTLNKNDMILREAGSQEPLIASVAVENGKSVPITWISSNPGVATVDAQGVVTAVADGEAKITALSPEGKFDTCVVIVGLAADKYNTEEDLADELKLPNPYIAVRLNRLS